MNECNGTRKFPNCLKLTSVTDVFRKGARTTKNNYRQASILPVFSKIFEKLLQNQHLIFFDNILSQFQCDSGKKQGRKICLLTMLEFWKDVTDKNNALGMLSTDSSEAFDCLCHHLLIKFAIFNPWKVRWNWIAFSQNTSLYHLVCYITWLDATLDDLQTTPLRQILIALRITNWIAKLHAYGLDKSFLKFLQDYLSNRKQRTKADFFFSSWEDILSGVL